MTCFDNCAKTPHWLLLSATLLLGSVFPDRRVEAQDVVPLMLAQQSTADSSEVPSNVRFTVETVSPFGKFTYVPNEWGDLHLRLENAGDGSRDLLCTSYFGGRPSLQFGRRVWLPAHSRLNISHPVRLPVADQLASGTATVHSLVLEGAGDGVLLKNESGQLRHERDLPVALDDRNTGVIAGWRTEDAIPQDVLDLVVASRVQQNLTNSVTVLGGQFLPADESSLQYLDHIVIADDRLVDDAAALAAVRRWLHAGGRLWVMLDRTDPIVLEHLLGDDFEGYLVDRVGLTSVRIDTAPSLTAPDGESGQTVEFEQPIELARMAAPGFQVWKTVNGWPAAMTKTFGEGRILVTTLGPRAWIKPTPPPGAKAKPRPAHRISAFAPISPMEELSAFVLAQRDPVALPESVLATVAEEHVSYHVPTRGFIVGIMVGFLALMFLAGWWLWRRERLERFGWVGSLISAGFGMLLIGMGMANRHSVPAALSSVQFTQAVGGTDDVRTHGVINVYRPETSDALVETSHGGRIWPDLDAVDGATVRMVMTDLGTFQWEGLKQSAGLRTYVDETSGSKTDRVSARATLDAQGIMGTYQGLSTSASDAVLATRSGRMGVKLSGDDGFTVAADDVLEPDQYLGATLLGDEQDRRRRILEQLFESRSWQESLDVPRLLLWLEGTDAGFQFGDGLQVAGETLLSVPVEFSRPAAGSQMVIPSPLLSLATTRPPDGSLPVSFWDDARQVWQERSGPSTAWMSFKIPHGLLPLVVTRARLQIKVSGPMGRLEILGVKGAEIVSLQTSENPFGTLEFEINDEDVLAVTDRGELALGLNAGVAADPSQHGDASPGSGGTPTYWRIESLALQLWATASESTEVD